MNADESDREGRDGAKFLVGWQVVGIDADRS
jgi:hypothetical protein